MLIPMVSPARSRWPWISMSQAIDANRRSASASAPPQKRSFTSLLQPAGHLTQHLIPDRMTEHIVDLFEAVEIDAQNGEALLRGRRFFERGRQAFVERRTVWQVGERIVMRQMRDSRFVALALSHVVDDGNHILR